jgi:hypothetical protein
VKPLDLWVLSKKILKKVFELKPADRANRTGVINLDSGQKLTLSLKNIGLITKELALIPSVDASQNSDQKRKGKAQSQLSPSFQ